MPIANFDLKTYKNNIFIETGTYNGDGVRCALEAGFQKIYSIELDLTRFNVCTEMFKENPNIVILQGDSAKVLPLLIQSINEPCTFWLDAHFCADHADIGEKWTPLVEELIAIKNHHIKNHTIIVDDFQYMDHTHFDEKTQKFKGFPGKNNLIETLKSINQKYTVELIDSLFEKDVVVAHIKN